MGSIGFKMNKCWEVDNLVQENLAVVSDNTSRKMTLSKSNWILLSSENTLY